MKNQIKLLNYHAPRWDEPILMEMSSPGERGILVPKSEKAVKEAISNPPEAS